MSYTTATRMHIVQAEETQTTGEAAGITLKYDSGAKHYVPQSEIKTHMYDSAGMPFGAALELCRQGRNIRRKHWVENSFVYLVPGESVPCTQLIPQDKAACKSASGQAHLHKDQHQSVQPRLNLHKESTGIVVGWSPSQSDLLAEDWIII